MKKYKKMVFGLVGFTMMVVGLGGVSGEAFAFSVTPMKQTITLQPGDTYSGRVSSFVMSESNGGEKMYYEASIAPLVVKDDDNQYFGVFDEIGDRNDIVNWTTISDNDETSEPGGKVFGSIDPGEKIDFEYRVTVPKDARGGGQYFAVYIKSVPNPNAEKSEGNLGIVDYTSIASVVYAEIAGDIKISGSITDNNVPGFLLSPPLTTSFFAKNDGNTHSEVTYYMQVFPLFSNEEVYTTEDNPGSNYVLPGTSRYIEQSWENTPAVGIFRVRQTVYYDSTDNEPSITEKIVIICPIWLIFIIVFIIFALIFYFVARAKARKKAAKSKSNQN